MSTYSQNLGKPKAWSTLLWCRSGCCEVTAARACSPLLWGSPLTSLCIHTLNKACFCNCLSCVFYLLVFQRASEFDSHQRFIQPPSNCFLWFRPLHTLKGHLAYHPPILFYHMCLSLWKFILPSLLHRLDLLTRHSSAPVFCPFLLQHHFPQLPRHILRGLRLAPFWPQPCTRSLCELPGLFPKPLLSVWCALHISTRQTSLNINHHVLGHFIRFYDNSHWAEG